MVEERERRRATMLKRLDKVNVDKLERRLASVGEALQAAETEHWREALAARLAEARQGAVGGDRRGRPDVHTRTAAPGADRGKKLRYGLEIAAESGVQRRAAGRQHC